mgnify:CR=1 FL=1
MSYFQIFLKQHSFLVFPNPAKDNITITSSLEINKVEVYTLLGKRVIQSTNTKSINIKKLSNAIYFVKVIYFEYKLLEYFVVVEKAYTISKILHFLVKPKGMWGQN